MQIKPEENGNYCYECGAPCFNDRYFCDKDCWAVFYERHPGDVGRRQLNRITKLRKKHGLPCRSENE